MNILMLRHSAGFEHTYLPDAEVAIKKIGVKNNWNVRTTHHCQGINAENLAQIDLLVFDNHLLLQSNLNHVFEHFLLKQILMI